MKIIWLVKKHFDVALDKATWIETVQALKRQGHQVTLVTGYLQKPDDFGLNESIRYVASLKVRYLNHLTFTLSCLAYALRLVAREEPDVVIADYNCSFLVPPLRLASKFGSGKTHFFLDVRTIPVETKGLSGRLSDLLFNLSIRYARRRFEGITVISSFMKRVLVDEYALKDDRVGIWSSGFSSASFSPENVDGHKLQTIRKELGLNGRFVVMYHGTLTANRGLTETVSAFKILSKQHPGISLLIVGAGASEFEIKQMVRNLELNGNVIVKGAVAHAEIPYYISLADLGILPFPSLLWWRVSSPIKLMEYLAMRKPVLLTDIEAHREVVGSNKCGFFLESNEPSLIARKIAEAYELGTEELAELGRLGRDLIENQYSWDAQAERLSSFLMHCVAMGGKSLA